MLDLKDTHKIKIIDFPCYLKSTDNLIFSDLMILHDVMLEEPKLHHKLKNFYEFSTAWNNPLFKEIA